MEKTAQFHVYRFVIEAASPLAIASGDGDLVLDSVLARDANGLPMIPATSLVGAFRARLSKDKAHMIFGSARKEREARSSVTFTDGLAHLADNRPRDGWQELPSPENDVLAAFLQEDAPVLRDHVKISEGGVVDSTGKFTRTAVPSGTRFTFEMMAWGDGNILETLADLLHSGIYLGGANRSGYGKLTCIRYGRQSFDFSTDKELGSCDAYVAYAACTLGDDAGFEMTDANASTQMVDGWMFDGAFEGPLLIGSPRPDGRGGRAPYKERRIKWCPNNRPSIYEVWAFPASAIKGPLRHRTLYHLRKSNSHDDPEQAVNFLFGSATEAETGQAGRLRFHDGVISVGDEIDEIMVSHVSLDRFTGGARDKSGALFNDIMIWQPSLAFEIDQLSEVEERTKAAFETALDDLTLGLLGVGAEWGEGAGIFDAERSSWCYKKKGEIE